MKNIFSTLIFSSLLAAAPVMAAETEASLPKSLTDLGITAQDLNDVQESAVDEATDTEMNLLRRYHRYCPRGYYLRAYRTRIGRIIIVRYRCVRYGHHHGPFAEKPGVQENAE